jgi:AcrR family transcriptional regulator
VTTQNAPAETGRVARKRAQRINEILRAAAQEISQRGLHEVNLDDIAERLDIAKATLYHYFPNKESLVTAAIELVGNDAVERIERVAGEYDDNPAERLRAIVAEQLTILLIDYPDVSRLFLQPNDWPEPYHSRIKKLLQRHYAVFEMTIREGLRVGALRTPAPEVALHCLHGALNHAHTWYRHKNNAQFHRFRDEVADTVLMMFNPTTRTAPKRRSTR